MSPYPEVGTVSPVPRESYRNLKGLDINGPLHKLQEGRFISRLWDKDATLWRSEAEHQKTIQDALGWLTFPLEFLDVAPLLKFTQSIQAAGFRHALLMGMGGSSLCPEVMRMTFGVMAGYPELHVLDSTVPDQISHLEKRLDLERTLCIVASKSGSTIEPLAFCKYFYHQVRKLKGEGAGNHFIAITDPGSRLEKMAKDHHFREIFPGTPDIGGRYSALSNFGIVPAALMGVDVPTLLHRAEAMRQRCQLTLLEHNPGVMLGIIMAQFAMAGRDKITLILSPALRSFGAWLEQLIAESTGKDGKGIVPINEEPDGDITVYGGDRLFVYIRDAGGADSDQDDRVSHLIKTGDPLIQFDLPNLIDIGAEFFRWEIATAVAGAMLHISPFDQPNVQESKSNTQKIIETFKTTQVLPEEKPLLSFGPLHIFLGESRGADQAPYRGVTSLAEVMKAHLTSLQPGDYHAMLAYVEKTEATHGILQAIRGIIRNEKKVATTLGYGPRFLHSTGQLHKGGANNGVFLQITGNDTGDLTIPKEGFTFGTLKRAQAIGDFQSLNTRGRRVLWIHIDEDLKTGLMKIYQALQGVKD